MLDYYSYFFILFSGSMPTITMPSPPVSDSGPSEPSILYSLLPSLDSVITNTDSKFLRSICLMNIAI